MSIRRGRKPISLLHSAAKNLCEDQIISPVIEVEELCCHIELYWIWLVHSVVLVQMQSASL